jgi:hypothetical protein
MADAVVQGATLRCTCGTTPSQLTVTSQSSVRIGKQLAATVQDVGPIKNIPLFGTCQALTAASGTPTPCALLPAGPWDPGSSRVVIGKVPALLSTDKLNCAAAHGEITIAKPGQEGTEDT